MLPGESRTVSKPFEAVHAAHTSNKDLPPIIETERTILRLFSWDTDDDTNFCLKVLNDSKVIAMMGDVKIRTRDDWVKKCATFTLVPQYSNGWNALCIYLMYMKDLRGDNLSGPILGFLTLRQLFQLPDIGYGLLPRAWGKGYATEGTRALYAFAKDQMGLERFIGFTPVGHTKSMHVLGKVGLVHIGQMVVPGKKEEDGSDMMAEIFVLPGMENEDIALVARD